MTTTEALPTHQSFATLKEAYAWANGLVNKGFPVQGSRLYEDLFKCARPRGLVGRYVKVLGISPKADRMFKALEPEGEWRVEVESPGTSYYKAGVFDASEHTTALHRFSVWYSRFLPYAYAMMMCENGFECLGADYQFINVTYTSCYGFVDLGHGDGHKDDYWRIDKADCDLFDDIYNASMRVRSPSLPFDEAFNPCCCYVAITKPKLFERDMSADHWVREHVADVCKDLDRECPVH